MAPVLAALAALISLSQLGALVSLCRRRIPSDRGSAIALLAGWHVVLGVSLLESWSRGWPHPAWAGALGAALFLLGSGLRFRAVRDLSAQFSPFVELRAGHRLITHGLYGRLRHPAYLGSALWAIALPLLLGSACGLLAVALAYAPALAYRLRVEEAMLATRFGEEWRAYRAATPALVPWPRRR